MTDNDTSFLLKELNTLSIDDSVHLIYQLIQKIHAYDHIVKILHDQNTQLRIRNAALEVSLRQVATLFAIQTMAGQHQQRTQHEQHRKQEQHHHAAEEEIATSKASTIDDGEQSSNQYHNSLLLSPTSLTVTHFPTMIQRKRREESKAKGGLFSTVSSSPSRKRPQHDPITDILIAILIIITIIIVISISLSREHSRDPRGIVLTPSIASSSLSSSSFSVSQSVSPPQGFRRHKKSNSANTHQDGDKRFVRRVRQKRVVVAHERDEIEKETHKDDARDKNHDRNGMLMLRGPER